MNHRVRLHPLVERDLDAIARWIVDHAGVEAAERRLGEIRATISSLAQTPHRGTTRDEIAPGLRAIPAGRKAVIAFTVDDDAGEVYVHTITYGGADWAARSRSRSR